METHFRPGGNSKEDRPMQVDRQAFSSTAIQNLNLQDRSELHRPCSSHGDNHHKVRSHVSNPSRVASGNHPMQQTRRVNAVDNDELVKDMSNLPRYLERGMKQQEKAFNIGVLDWSLLEKWQSSNQVPYRSDGSSSSNSNSSSLLSTEESSTHSQTGHSYSIAHHRHQHSAYQLKLKGISSEACSLEGKFSHSCNRNQEELHEESDTNLGLESTTAFSKNGYWDSHNFPSSSKRQPQRPGDSEKETRRFRRTQSMSLNHKSSENDVKAVHARHYDDCFIASKSKDLKVATIERSPEENGMSCSEIFRTDYSELSSDVPRSFLLPIDVNDRYISIERPCRSQGGKINDRASAAGSQLHSARKPNGPLKEGSSEDNHTVLMAAVTTVKDLPQGSRISKCTVDAAKAIYSSPSDRFSFGIGAARKKTSSTDDAEMMQACSTHAIAKPCTTRELHSTSLGKSNRDKSPAARKARSSPLKRLLDPLLKPREGNNSRSSKRLDRDSKPLGRISKTLDRPSTAPGIREGLSLSSEKLTSIHNPHYNEKDRESEVVQALLQVVVKNGCPLVTFAVDSVKDILCAALSQLSTKKEFEDRYLYTLFSVHELKNKSWTNLRGKASGHKYSPNVVAQIEVSETMNAVDRQSLGKNIFREFVLSTVDLKTREKADSPDQLNDELASVIIDIPGKTDDNPQIGKFYGTTVILPRGIHTVPSKGKPSSLIERWRSGGQCDCGGWDSGCDLKILTDSKCPSSSAKYELFDQGGAEETQPVFTLSPYKDKEGVLSVSFSSSVSPLQAFSICIALLDTKKHPGPRTLSNSQEAKNSVETSPVHAPCRYVAVPPHSPVGRV
ncbi:unnamed protein product [Rhodiola kirilowii]